MDSDRHVSIRTEDDIVAARQHAREMARALGFGAVDQSRITTAVSELARNIVRYATNGAGEVYIRALSPSARGTGIEIRVEDTGPGIADIEQVMQAGYTSGQGMGMGLPGTKRLMDEMDLHSVLAQGTTIAIRKWHR